jgi:hypothetical protein
MRKHWDRTKAVQQNLADFGLAFDANASVKVKTTRSEFVEKAKGISNKVINKSKALRIRRYIIMFLQVKEEKDSAITESKDTYMIRMLQKEAEEEFDAQRAKTGFRFTKVS